MKQQDIFFMIGLITLSALSSFTFIFYGMNIILSDNSANGLMMFAYVTTAYGLANISILSIAWSSREPWAKGASKFISLCFLGVFVMDTINKGMKSGLGAIGIVVLFLILCANWLAISKVVDRDEPKA